MDTKSNQHNNI